MIYSTNPIFWFCPDLGQRQCAGTLKITRRNTRFEAEIPSNIKQVSNRYLVD